MPVGCGSAQQLRLGGMQMPDMFPVLLAVGIKVEYTSFMSTESSFHGGNSQLASCGWILVPLCCLYQSGGWNLTHRFQAGTARVYFGA